MAARVSGGGGAGGLKCTAGGAADMQRDSMIVRFMPLFASGMSHIVIHRYVVCLLEMLRLACHVFIVFIHVPT